MSDEVSIRGKLTPVDLGPMTLEEKADSLVIEEELEEYKDEYGSSLMVLNYESNYYFDQNSNTLYKLDAVELDSGYFIEMNRRKDGSITFYTRFYNGSTHLTEMLDEGFESLE